MRQTTGTRKSPGEKIVKDIKRATRKHYSSEEKIRIVLDGLRGEDSIVELCRRCTSSEFGVFAQWNNSMGLPISNRIVAFTRVVGPVRRDAGDLLIWRNLTEQIWQNRRVPDTATCYLAIDDYFVITCRQWIARISSVCSSIPICILRHRWRLGPPCLRAFHSPSPSIARQVSRMLPRGGLDAGAINQEAQWPL